mmetsp:Transcript_5412/g.15004  ORF Transcript_5412/g.15004 Transcript_5412/m.15004 type:complete len:117 (+) Transcript_5412:1318-1668(+)
MQWVSALCVLCVSFLAYAGLARDGPMCVYVCGWDECEGKETVGKSIDENHQPASMLDGKTVTIGTQGTTRDKDGIHSPLVNPSSQVASMPCTPISTTHTRCDKHGFASLSHRQPTH